jgi:hypothetical protein
VARKLVELLGELFVRRLAWVEHVEKAVGFFLKADHFRLRERTIMLHTLVMTVGQYRGRERDEFRRFLYPFLREPMADRTIEDGTMRLFMVR